MVKSRVSGGAAMSEAIIETNNEALLHLCCPADERTAFNSNFEIVSGLGALGFLWIAGDNNTSVEYAVNGDCGGICAL